MTIEQHPFVKAFRSEFRGIMRWRELDELWQRLKEDDFGWYIYTINETPPEVISDASELHAFIQAIDTRLRKEHGEDYCGIVYVDNPGKPEFIKIFNPHNLGIACGYSDKPPLPGWILSKEPPCDLPDILYLPTHGWKVFRRLFGNA